MDQDGMSDKPARGGLSHSGADAITAMVVVIIGAVMMVDNYALGASWGTEGPQSGFFPFYIGLILSISGAAVFMTSVYGANRNRTTFVSWDRFRLVLMVLIPTAIYVLVIQFAGIYVASVLFIGAFMRVMGKSTWTKTALVSLCTVGLLFWLFEIQFMVPLPKGPIEALLSY